MVTLISVDQLLFMNEVYFAFFREAIHNVVEICHFWRKDWQIDSLPKGGAELASSSP